MENQNSQRVVWFVHSDRQDSNVTVYGQPASKEEKHGDVLGTLSAEEYRRLGDTPELLQRLGIVTDGKFFFRND